MILKFAMVKSTTLTVATLALVALGGCTAPPPAVSPAPSTALPDATVEPGTTPVPADPGTTTTPGTRPRPTLPGTPRATPTSTNEVPGDLGTPPVGFKLPDEDRPGDDETTAFLPTVWQAACADGSAVTLPPLTSLVASTVKESTGPERAEGNGLLVFTDEAAATAFLSAVRTGVDACAADSPAEDGYRTHQETVSIRDLGDGGFVLRSWSQYDSEGSWVDAPGASLQYLVREGRHVAMTFEGGEYVGDPALIRQATMRARQSIDAVLDQV